MATFNTINRPRTNNIIQKTEDKKLEVLEGIVNALKKKAEEPDETLWDLDDVGDLVVKIDPDHNGIYDFLEMAKAYAQEASGYKDEAHVSQLAAAQSAADAQAAADSIVQVPSDWNATEGVAEILNKPDLKKVATTGSYTDLINVPNLMLEPNVVLDADPENLNLVKNTIYKLGTIPGNQLIIYSFELSNYETTIYLKTTTETTVKVYPSYKSAGISFIDETLEAGMDYVISIQNDVILSARLDSIPVSTIPVLMDYGDGSPVRTVYVDYGGTVPNPGAISSRTRSVNAFVGWYEMKGNDYKYNPFDFSTPITNFNSGLKLGALYQSDQSNVIIYDRHNNIIYNETLPTTTIITSAWLEEKFPSDAGMKNVRELYAGGDFEIIKLPYKLVRPVTQLKII